MPDSYYGGAPNAFAGGVEFGAAQRARRLRENALNALVEQYGPEAGDPVAAAQMQAIEQRAQMQPYELAQAEQQRQAGEAAAQARVQAERVQVAQRAANVLQMVKQKKGDLGSAFDFVSETLPQLGFPPEQLPQMRDQIVSNPDSVDELIELLKNPSGDRKALSGGQPMINDRTGKLEWVVPTESGFRTVEGYTPATAAQAQIRLQQGARRLTLEEAKARGFDAPEGYQIWENPDGSISAAPLQGSKQEQEFEKSVREADATDEKFIKQYSVASEHGQVVETSIDRALERMDDSWIQQHGIISSNARKLVAKVAGTNTNEIAQSIEAIKNNIAIDELQRMRQSSPTGGALGAISDRDMSLLQGALGRLEIDRDPKLLREDLENIAQVYEKIGEAARQDAEAATKRMEERKRRSATPPPAVREPVPGEAPPSTPRTTKPLTYQEALKKYGSF